MLSLKKSKSSVAIAHNPCSNSMIYFNKDASGSDEIELDNKKMYQMPNKNIVEKIYITGPSGVGKSTWICNYIILYQKFISDKVKVYLITQQDKDEALDDLDNLFRVKIDEIDKIDQLEPFKNSIFIFDDIDTLKSNRKAVYSLRDKILTNGRHFNIRIIATEHLLSNYKESRILINEATSIIIYPQSNKANIKRFLNNKLGLSEENCDKIIKTKSRWVSVNRSYPMYAVSEKGAFVLN